LEIPQLWYHLSPKGRLGPERRTGGRDDHAGATGVELLWPDCRRVGHGAAKIGARQVRPGEVGAANIRLLKVRSLEMSSRQVSAGEVGGAQICVLKLSVPQGRGP
jgi:hypothetical protein